MDSQQPSAKICLPHGRPMPLKDAAGTRVRCLRGTIWITVASEPDDIFLQAGQSYLIPRNGLSLLERVGTDSVELEKQRPASKLKGWFNGLVLHLKIGTGR